jgi:DNA (cytosine-5)-methyltransferase 1
VTPEINWQGETKQAPPRLAGGKAGCAWPAGGSDLGWESRMKIGSLFSGIGGFDLGLERAGMQVVWQVENNPYCIKVLEKHWPHVKRYGDIREVDFTRVEPVDLICGGFPCQPVSCAGKREGDKDERWLWPEFYRAICEAQPRWILVENVPGLLSAQDGRLFGGILRDLAASGYDAEWDLLPAAAFGAPHLRFRPFLVACPEGKPIRAGFCQDKQAEKRRGRSGDGHHTQNDSDTHGGGLSERNRIFPQREKANPTVEAFDWWTVEPDVGRVAHGIPARVDRLKGLGNAIVPQVAEWLGRRIMMAAHRIKGEMGMLAEVSDA